MHIANTFTYKVESIYHYYLNNEERSCNHNCLFPVYLIVIVTAFGWGWLTTPRHTVVKTKEITLWFSKIHEAECGLDIFYHVWSL